MRMIWAASLPGTRARGGDRCRRGRADEDGRRHDDRNERFCAQLENAHVAPFFQHVAVSADGDGRLAPRTGDGGRRERPGRGRGRGDVGRSPGGSAARRRRETRTGNRARGELFGFSGSSCVWGLACGGQDTGRSRNPHLSRSPYLWFTLRGDGGHAHPPVVVVNPVASRVADSSRRGRLVESVVAAVEARTGQTPIVVDASPEAGPGGADGGEPPGQRRSRSSSAATGRSARRPRRWPARASRSAIVPAGTGNVFAAALGIPRRHQRRGPPDRRGAAGRGRSRQRLVGQHRRRPAARSEGSMAFAVACGIGFDARVMSTASTELKRRLGFFAYVVATLREAARLRPVAFRIEADGEVHEVNGLVVLVANCGQLIPGLIGPRHPIDPTDGLPRRDRRDGARHPGRPRRRRPSRCSPRGDSQRHGRSMRFRAARGPGRRGPARSRSRSTATPTRRTGSRPPSCRARSGSCVHEPSLPFVTVGRG